MSDTFTQLANRLVFEFAIKLRLPEQHNLHELVVMGFKVAEQPYFFQRFQRHALRFFDEHHHTGAGSVSAQQVVLQLLHHHQAVGVGIYRQLQLEGNGVNDVACAEFGVGEANDIHCRRQSLFQHAAEHGFAAADFAHHLQNNFTSSNAIYQGVQHHAKAMGAAVKEQRWVRGDAERVPLQ